MGLPNLGSIARGVRLPLHPLCSRPRVMRFGCAAAAGTAYAVGVGKLRRARRSADTSHKTSLGEVLQVQVKIDNAAFAVYKHGGPGLVQ